MRREIAQEGAGSERRLIDEAYLIWVAAATECARALRTWFTSTSRDSTDAYWNYRAALDREEAAARDLQLLETVSPEALRSGRAGLRSSTTSSARTHDS
jgi:hypothetical protein